MTIRLATLDEIPAYREPPRRPARNRRPEHRRAMYIGGGGITIPGDPLGSVGFSGNFASLFTPGTVLQSVQSDLGLTYGGTPLPTAGNTSTTALTLTGSLAGVPVPIWWKATNTLAIGAGAMFTIYYDGAGVTPAMTGVTPTAGVPVPLTGAATGLSIAWSAGTSVNNDTWKATCAALADQGPGAKHYAQAGPTLQPVVALALNGFPGLLFDGVDDVLSCTTLTLPAPATTPTYVLCVWNIVAALTNNQVFGDNANQACVSIIKDAGNAMRNQNGAVGALAAFTPGTWYRSYSEFANSLADVIKIGSTQNSGALSGNITAAGRALGSGLSALRCNCSVLAIVYLNAPPSPAQLAAYDAAVVTKYTSAVQV